MTGVSAMQALPALDDYLMRCLINSTIEGVSKTETISSDIIQRAVDQNINQAVDWTKVQSLETIGIDEIALRKGHDSYVTVISAKAEDSLPIIIAILEGREKDTVKSLLQSIPANLSSTVKHVCTDMYDGYVNAAIEVCGALVPYTFKN